MKIGLIGVGAIGRYVGQQLQSHGLAPMVTLVRTERLKDTEATAARYVGHVDELPADISLMIDCAGHAALIEHGPAILERGTDLITLSVGALADDDLHERLTRAAVSGGSQLQLASGAIGALDCLSAARIGGLSEVTYTGRKPPQGWKGSPAEATLDLDSLSKASVHFAGTAREAALRYPKNANVAAAVALAGLGLDDTRVELIADPEATANVHQVRACGQFGHFRFDIEGQALPDNPRSSALAAMSAVAAVQRRRSGIVL